MWMKISTLLTIVASLCGGAPVEDVNLYTRTMYISEMDYNQDVVYCVDAVGHEWSFYGCEDYMEGDLITCWMAEIGEPNYIWDDAIINVEYSGFWLANVNKEITGGLEISGSW